MNRNRFHALCPYFAMFPETFVQKHLVWARPDDVVFDPFSGRGTTVFETLSAGRRAAACDINPVAVCISRAKAHLPPLKAVLARLKEIEQAFMPSEVSGLDPFFSHCFHQRTLAQVVYLRAALNWKRSTTDCFLAAVALGRLHGESHRSPAYFSNRMPRTISTKPDYSVRWWQERGYIAPERDVFAIMRSDILYRYESEIPTTRGRVRAGDARSADRLFPDLRGSVGLVITSPPYLDTTNFEEDQWLRLWFLGGPMRPSRVPRGDHRHFSADLYWRFLEGAWRGLAPLLRRNARLIIRIGGTKVTFDTAEEGLTRTLRSALGQRLELVEKSTSEIKGGQHRSFRPALKSSRAEYDFHWRLAG
jgi:hypothetical protein